MRMFKGQQNSDDAETCTAMHQATILIRGIRILGGPLHGGYYYDYCNPHTIEGMTTKTHIPFTWRGRSPADKGITHLARLAWPGLAWLGLAWPGMAWPGSVKPGLA